jgi:protein-disulfide isomerase
MKKPADQKLSKPLVTAVIIVAAIVLIGGIKYFKWNQAGAGKTALARVIGNPNAPVKIVEYVDFQCPACASGAADLKKYLSTFPDKIYLEVKYYPLGGHMHALTAAKFVECAAREGKFWPYSELVFERQAQWRDLFDSYPVFEAIAKEVGLDHEKMQACVASDDVREKVLKEKDEGTSLGVKSTPTYFVNGQMMVGPKPMKEAVEKALGGAAH